MTAARSSRAAVREVRLPQPLSVRARSGEGFVYFVKGAASRRCRHGRCLRPATSSRNESARPQLKLVAASRFRTRRGIACRSAQCFGAWMSGSRLLLSLVLLLLSSGYPWGPGWIDFLERLGSIRARSRQGRMASASTCAGRTTLKWRWSSVATLGSPSISVAAMTVASTSPSGRSR